jgi:hypothetical protein
MSSPSYRVAQLSLALGVEIIACAMPANLVDTSSYPFLAPLHELFDPLASYIVTFGPPLFWVYLVTSITWSSLIIAPTTCRPFRYARCPTPSPPSSTSSPMCPRSLPALSGVFSKIMDVCLITHPPTLSSSLKASNFWCRISTLLHKTKRMIRTTNDVMRSLLFRAFLPACYLAKSLHAATYLLNLLPTKVADVIGPTVERGWPEWRTVHDATAAERQWARR